MRGREFLALVVLIAAATQALAQNWPQQAIHFIISFGAGGGADIVGRILADAMLGGGSAASSRRLTCDPHRAGRIIDEYGSLA
jgi:hypothetical protein